MRSPVRLRPLVALVALALAFGCSEAGSPTAPKAPPPDASLIGVVNGLLGVTIGVTKGVTNLLGDLLVCTLQPENRNSATIGPNGGTLNFGPHSLVIPKGALKTSTRITADAVRGYHARVEFSPSGLQFSQPATLTLSYAKCSVPKSAVKIVYMKSDTTVTETEPSHDYRDQRWVSATIRHFSSYAVAY